ncbi:MAG: hypothetical protein J1E60_01290 [Christensenellaceae bacterium]|nr:hypothetical protein [Christensenellaceae bacterium]
MDNDFSENIEPIDKNEPCALCGAATDVPQSRPVDERDCYIYGAGQLCRECYDKVSNITERVNHRSYS